MGASWASRGARPHGHRSQHTWDQVLTSSLAGVLLAAGLPMGSARRLALLGIVVLGFILAAPQVAAPCSPPAPVFDPPCLALRVSIPGTSFPAQLDDQLRISSFDEEFGSQTAQATFDPNITVLVHRETEQGVVAVDFSLIEDAALQSNTRRIDLAESIPGRYVISSPNETCTANPSPSGEGLLLSEFVLEPEVPLPTLLGDLRSLGQEIETRSFESGPDSACENKTINQVVARAQIELTLDTEALPWAAATSYSIHVDGELAAGFRRLNSSDGVALVDFTLLCETSDSGHSNTNNALPPGEHTVKLVAQVGDLAEFESTETTISLDCDQGGGCSVSDSQSRSLPVLLGLAFLFAWRRRRARL